MKASRAAAAGGPANPLRRLRRGRDLSQAVLASMVGTQRTTIAAWEQGRQRPQARFMPALAAALGVSEAVLAPLRAPAPATVLRIAPDGAARPGPSVAAAATADNDRLAERFVESLLDGLSSGHATDPMWVAAAAATARLLGVPWSPTVPADGGR